MSAEHNMRLDALLRLNGAGRLARFVEEIPDLTPGPLTDDQAIVLDQLVEGIHQLVIRERDEALAMYGEVCL